MRNVILFQFFFSLLSIGLIPLLSAYGVQACPVLKSHGFISGCYYNSFYIFFLNFVNILLLFFILAKNRAVFLKQFYLRNDFLVSVLLYVIATAFALLTMKVGFGIESVFSSRTPHIFILVSMLLGLVQAYGYSLVGVKEKVLRALPAQAASHFNSALKQDTLRKNWLTHIFRIFNPILVFILIITHFILSQKISMNVPGFSTQQASTESLIDSLTVLISILLVWLAVVFTLYFAAEAKMVSLFENHLVELKNLSLYFRSPLINSWGLWKNSLQQLNELTSMVAEKTRLLKNFSKFVADDVVRNAAEIDFNSNVGQSRELTVIMIDIRGFTTITEKITPQQVVTLLNEYFSVMLERCAQFSIQIDKFIGDGILAYVNDEATSQLIQNKIAVDAALSMQDGLVELNARLEKMQLPQIKIGIGIDRGPLVIGLIGSSEKLQHTIIGDSVNRAARLESLNKSLGSSLVISENVWLDLDKEKRALFQKSEKQKLSGIEKALTVYNL